MSLTGQGPFSLTVPVKYTDKGVSKTSYRPVGTVFVV